MFLCMFVYIYVYMGTVKRYYIKEVVTILEISKNTLYRWEKAKKISLAKRDSMSNYRYWTEEDLQKLKKKTGRG